jgi:hypothetical protein
MSLIDNSSDDLNSYLAMQVWGSGLPEEWQSLEDLGESLLRGLKEYDDASGEDRLDEEILYIQSFLDTVHAWSSNNGNNLHQFLEWFRGQDVKIASPDDSNAVRIMTIHKSKGLEFPYVIVPFVENVKLGNLNDHWCSPELSGTSLKGAEGVYDVDLSSSLVGTGFDSAYKNELKCNYMDAINMMYVAMTRASVALHVIYAAKDRDRDNFAKLVQKAYPGGFSIGDLSDLKVKEKADTQPIEADLKSYRPKGRLKIKADASSFFDEGESLDMIPRLKGIVLHGILSEVEVPEDLDGAVADAAMGGDMDASEAEKYRDFLRAAIASRPEWFPSEGATVRNETQIMTPEGESLRPDRVVTDDSGTVVIDYKFGSVERPEYIEQVSKYVSLYRDMGFKNVRGAVWYMGTGKVAEVM